MKAHYISYCVSIVVCMRLGLYCNSRSADYSKLCMPWSFVSATAPQQKEFKMRKMMRLCPIKKFWPFVRFSICLLHHGLPLRHCHKYKYCYRCHREKIFQSMVAICRCPAQHRNLYTCISMEKDKPLRLNGYD